MTSSFYIGEKNLLHKVTPHKFGSMIMSAFFVLVIGIDRYSLIKLLYKLKMVIFIR